jgi:hypothetical protein
MAMVTPASSLAVAVARLAAPYLQAGNVSHGYAFFAPDPGPSHLIRYELVFEDGRVEQGVFPDLARQWPRLRYHRHFMLTEQLSNLAPPAMPDGQVIEAGVEYIDPATAEWIETRDRFLRQARSYAEHLLHAHRAQRVTLHLIRHEIPSREEVLQGRRLDVDSSYRPYFMDPLITVEAVTAQ